MHFIAPQETSLLELLQSAYPDTSKSNLRSWIKNGRVLVDQKKAHLADLLIKRGAKITILPKTHRLMGKLNLLYSDSHIAVVEKPCGLLSVSTAFEKVNCAHAILKNHFHPRPVFVVHRLDQDTSGVMLFALSQSACQRLKTTFEKHEITRKYLAIVEGSFTPMQGTWRSYLFEDKNYYVHSDDQPSEGAELAITHYKVEKNGKNYARLSLSLETGKKNQIRVHCKAAGHPVVGDRKYGATSNPIKRVCLHAYYLGFNHPLTGKPMHFESTPPESFYNLA